MMLLANGCSMTAGEELGGQELDSHGRLIRDLDPEYKMKHAWPHLLSDHVGMSCINIAEGGSSNDKIARTTFEWIANYLTDNDAQDLFVVIGWSHPCRIEFKVGDKWFDFMPQWEPSDKTLKKIHKFYKDHIYDDDSDSTRTIVNILSLQSWLKANNIPYLFFSALEINYKAMPPSLQTMIDCIDSTHYHGFGDGNLCMHQICLPYPKGARNHTLEQGHAAWAATQYKHIQENKLLEGSDV